MAPIIHLKPIELLSSYRDKRTGRYPLKTFWLHEKVIGDFGQLYDAWYAKGGIVRVTEAWRSIAVQRKVYGSKPGLQPPGWSAHGHGRAVDVDWTSVSITVNGATLGHRESLVAFYKHAEQYRWVTIFYPDRPYPEPGHSECWHIQCFDGEIELPLGIRCKVYMQKWAEEQVKQKKAGSIFDALLNLQTVKIKYEG